MIGRYIPCMMCMSTGGVPQWTMKTPGSFAVNSNRCSWRGGIMANALSIGIRAA